jgi:hypothetical protein
MAISVKISQLIDGGSVNSADYLPIARGVDTYKIPASQLVVAGQNVGSGSGGIFLNTADGNGRTLQFRTLSGTEGISIANAGNTLVISTSGQNPVKTSLTGNGTTTTFALNGATSVNPNNYRVDIDGVLQEPINDYNIVGSNIVFTSTPPTGSKVTVVSNNLVRAFDVVPSDGSVTPQKLSAGGLNWNTLGQTGIGTSTPNAAAVLDLTSTTRGFLPPRVSQAQRDAITSPPAGLIIYNNQTNKLNFYNGTAWEQIG